MKTTQTHDHDYKIETDNIEGKKKKKTAEQMLNKKMLL
jgi:hypothetical protein